MADSHRVEGIRRLEAHAQSLISRMRASDKEARDILVNICRSKVHDEVTRLQTFAEQNALDMEIATGKSIEIYQKRIQRKNASLLQKFYADEKMLEDLTVNCVRAHAELLREADNHLYRMDMAHAESVERHFHICMGIYIERGVINDDLHVGRITGIMSYMNSSLDLLLKMLCRANLGEEHFMITQIDSMIEQQLTELNEFAEKTMAENIVTNDEIIADLIALKIKDGGEPFIR